MTSWQLRPGGLYVPPDAADGPYLAQKDGNRFSQWLRLVDGDNTTVVTDPDAGTVQVDSTGGGSGGAGEPHIDTDTATTGADLVMTLTAEPAAPEALLVFWRGVGLDPTQYSYVGTALTVLDQGWTTGDLVWAAYWSEVPTVVTDPTTTLGDILVRGPSGLTRLPVGPDTYVLTADSGATDGLDWEPPSGGGGGGLDWPLMPATLNPTYGDHFTGASLAGIWTLRGSYVSGDLSFQQGADGTFLRVAARGPNSYISQAPPAGDWTLVMRGIPYTPIGNTAMWGLLAVDNSGNGIGAGPYTGNNMLVGTIAAGLYNSTGFQDSPPGAAAGAGSHVIYGSQMVWLRVKKVGTGYKFSYSLNGEIWSPDSNTHTNATAITRIGFGNFYNTGTGTNWFDVDFFDVQ